jgi:hypothetical protein
VDEAIAAGEYVSAKPRAMAAFAVLATLLGAASAVLLIVT